jgi:hypothetical protein
MVEVSCLSCDVRYRTEESLMENLDLPLDHAILRSLFKTH